MKYPDIKNESKTVLIIGGGLAGLFSAKQFLGLGYHVIVIEKQGHLGGLSTSIPYNGYNIDIGPHFMTIPRKSEFREEIKELLGDKIVPIPDIHKWYRVFLKNSILNEYPSLYNMIFKKGMTSLVHSIVSYSVAKIKYSFKKGKIKSSKDYIISNYGEYLYKNWFKPYLDFNYGKNNQSISIIQERFPEINFRDTFNKIKGSRNKKEISSNELVDYWYFKQGIGTLPNALAENIEKLGGMIKLSTDIKKIIHEKQPKEITIIEDGKEQIISADIILYTTPPIITKNWFEHDFDIEYLNQNLSNGILIIFFIDQPKIVDWWLMTNYDTNFSFFRITQQNYLSDEIAPSGKSLLCIEINTKENKKLWDLDESELITIIKNDLKQMKILNVEKIESHKIFKFKNLYQGPQESENSILDEVSKIIKSQKNEFMISAHIDPGTLVTKRVEESDKTEKQNISLGGIYMALEKSRQIVTNINKKE